MAPFPTMRCLVTPAQWTAAAIDLPPDASHHLLRVLRVRPGERVGLLTGQGHAAEATVASAAAGRVTLAVLAETRRETPPPAVAVTLFQAIPKHALMDTLVRQAVELGVRELVPLMTERVIVRLAPREAERRVARWRRLAREALCQCGRAWLPAVQPVCTAAEAAARVSAHDLVLLGALRPGARPLGEVLAPWRGRAPARLGLVIGPEGDLSDAELDAFTAAGARPVTFGAGVLRVDTAALYGLSVLLHETGRD